MGPAGTKGDKGDKGDKGEVLILDGGVVTGPQGKPGDSVRLMALPAGDLACPQGGVRLIVDGGTATVCNGTPGSQGAAGPQGLPGGYPVRLQNGALDLDLPSALTRAEAIAWNLAYEEESGLVIGPDGQARYTGTLRDLLAAHSGELAAGFNVRDLPAVTRAMSELRSRLEKG